MHDPKILGAAIRDARSQLQFSQTELANALGVSRATISYWELGQTLPQPQNMVALREILGAAFIEPSPPLALDQLSYWRGRVEQVARHLEIVLAEQRQLANDMLPASADPLPDLAAEESRRDARLRDTRAVRQLRAKRE